MPNENGRATDLPELLLCVLCLGFTESEPSRYGGIWGDHAAAEYGKHLMQGGKWSFPYVCWCWVSLCDLPELVTGTHIAWVWLKISPLGLPSCEFKGTFLRATATSAGSTVKFSLKFVLAPGPHNAMPETSLNRSVHATRTKTKGKRKERQAIPQQRNKPTS